MKHKHHKIIFKNSQRIRTNELVTYTVEEHAAEHKRLYKKYGHWKDKLAWQGLSGQIKSKDVIMEMYRLNGKANVYRMHTDEVKRKAIQRTKEVNTGRVFTLEHRKKISEAGMNRPVSDSQRIKVSEKLAKEYIIEAPNGTKYNIKNLRKFAISKQLDQGNLTKVAQGKLMSHKGYKVQYK